MTFATKSATNRRGDLPDIPNIGARKKKFATLIVSIPAANL
jgi:hypothetical protein